MTREEAKKCMAAIRNLDEVEIRRGLEIMDMPIHDDNEFWTIVHGIRADYRFSGATKEQVEESMAWLEEHGCSRMIESVKSFNPVLTFDFLTNGTEAS